MNRTSAVALFLVSLMSLLLAATTQQGGAQHSEMITINADGTVDPADAPIHRVGNTYTLVSSVDRIVVSRSNIIFDGNGYTPSGSGVMMAVYLGNVRNVTVKNLIIARGNITGGDVGIFLDVSSDCTIVNNTITGTHAPLLFNWISGGIVVWGGNSNTITGNHMEDNMVGIFLGMGTEHNLIVNNNLTGNTVNGLNLAGSSNNTVLHNRFLNNTVQVYSIDSSNMWDDGSQGNFWSDYNGTDADGDGVGDTPYVIDENNQDHYPLKPSTNSSHPDGDNLSAATAVIAASAVAATFGATALFYFKKRRRQTQKQQRTRPNNVTQQTHCKLTFTPLPN